MSRPSLRDELLAALRTLPNTVPLDLVVLSSAPKRTTEIFPHAPSSAVRCIDREYLVVVSCGVPSDPSPPAAPSESASNGTGTGAGNEGSGNGTGTGTGTEGRGNGDGNEGSGNGNIAKAPPSEASDGKILAAAISAHVYTLPNSAARLVYVSKVDSSGYASACGPLTRVLASSFIGYFLSGPGTVAATLFARAQGQYLFPNSVEGGGKRVLGGLGLCAWWKRVFEDAAGRLVSAGGAGGEEGEGVGKIKARQIELSYLLPSYSEQEARGMLPSTNNLAPGLKWTYGPPFTHRVLPGTSLATLIPSLPDDPKTRFLEELVDDALDKEPYSVREKKRPSPDATESADAAADANAKGDKEDKPEESEKGKKEKLSRREKEQQEDEDERRRAYAALEKVPVDEFWERMGFRQECASGDVTGFFHCLVVPDPEGEDVTAAVAAEDAEKLDSPARPASETDARRASDSKPPSGKEANVLPHALVERILTSMLNTDFGTRALASAGTSAWTAATRALVVDAIGEDGWRACTGSVDAKEGVERVQKRKEETVTMLQPRKKKR